MKSTSFTLEPKASVTINSLLHHKRRAFTPSPVAQTAGSAAPIPPLPGHSDDEVLSCLHDAGAGEVEVLAPGFISARLAPARFSRLTDVAVVHPKATKRPSGG